MSIRPYQQSAESVARWAMVGMFFLFPIKTSLSNVLLAVMLVGWLVAGQFRKRWNDIKNHPITPVALAMYGLVVVGIAYTPADSAHILQHLNKYSKFLILLVCMSLLMDAIWRERCRKAFMFAMVFVVLSTYANIWLRLPWSVSQVPGWGLDHTVAKDYIFQGICTAVFVLMAWSEAMAAPRPGVKGFWAAMAVLAGLSCVYLLGGRTGALALTVALIFYVLSLFRRRVRWVSLASLLLVACFVVTVPGVAKNKFHEALREVERHQQLAQPGQLTIDRSSTGARLMMWTLSLQEIMKRPLIGAGTGSYQHLARERLEQANACSVACVHPHNQFLFFGVEYGLVGLLAFGLYFVKAGQHALKLPAFLKATTLGFLGVFLVDSLVHGAMWLSGEQHLFTYMLALWMSYPASRPADTAEIKSPAER